jgi:hypothetical protein
MGPAVHQGEISIIVIGEYQDLGLPLHRIVSGGDERSRSENRRGVQSIYAFTGAKTGSAQNIGNMGVDYWNLGEIIGLLPWDADCRNASTARGAAR